MRLAPLRAQRHAAGPRVCCFSAPPSQQGQPLPQGQQAWWGAAVPALILPGQGGSSAAPQKPVNAHYSASSAITAHQQQQQSAAPLPRIPPVSSVEESEFLWAGYTDLAEQLHHTRAHNHSLQMEVESLTTTVRRLQDHHEQAAAAAAHQARHPFAAAAGATGGAWQAASFLLLFLVVINIAGAIASFHLAAASFTWFGWGGVKAQAAGSFFTRPMLGAITAAVPLANSAVVVVFCIQAVKAAWLCLRF